jgi:hypothetical protein
MSKTSRSDLLNALEAVKGAVAAKFHQPILTHVLIADNTVLGYDSEIGIRVKMPKGLGATFNVRFEHFHSLVKNLDADEIDIRVEGKKIHIACGSHRSVLTQLEEEFPKPNASPKKDDWRDLPAVFRDAMERTLSALPVDEKDRGLGALYISGGSLYATDRQKAIRCTIEGLDVPPVLLPPKGCGELIKLGNPKRMAVTQSVALFDFGNLMFLTRIREGVEEFKVTADRFDEILEKREASEPVPEGLAAALTRLLIFALVPPMAKLEVGGKAMTLSVEGATAEATETLAKPKVAIEPKAFAPDKLLSALQYAEGIDWGAPEEPIYLRADIAGFEFLLAPMKVS